MVANLCSVGERRARSDVLWRRAVGLVAAMLTIAPLGAGADDRDPCLDNIRPVADAGPNRSEATGSTLTFDGSASYDPDDRDLNFFIWYFGDGQVGRGPVVSHTYHQPGTYVVTLTVTDSCRTRGSDSAIVTISGDAQEDPNDPVDPCDSNSAPVARLSGSPSAVVGTAVLFNAATSTDVDDNIESYAWDFGDDGVEEGPLAGHVFTAAGLHTVSVTVTDDCGASSVASLVVNVANPNPCANNARPVARANVTGTREPGSTLWFSAASSTDGDGWVETYSWRFGDGTLGSGRTASHVFAVAGNYTVVLTVADNCGATAQTAIPVSVVAANPCEGNAAPRAHAGSDRSVNVGTSVAFDAALSSDDGTISSFRWNFGDGSSATGRTASHVFASAGTFTVTLTVTDNCGASATDSAVVSVSSPDDGGAVSASFAATPTTPRVQEVVAFSASQAAPYAGNYYFRWDFGDGSYPGYGGAEATRAFTRAGTFTVTLTLIDKATWQVVDSSSRVVEVSERLFVEGVLAGTLANNNDVVVVGNSAWVCGSPNKLALTDVSDASNPVLVSVSSVYGSPTSMAANNSVVALAASYGGVLLYDAQNANAIVQLGRIDTYSDGAFRAFGVAFDGNKLFVTGEWGGLRVYDVSNVQSPTRLANSSDAGFLRLITVKSGRAYVLDASIPGVRIFNVSNASNPVEMGQVRTGAEPLRMDVASTSVGTLLAVSEGNHGLELFDVTNPASAQFRSKALGVNGVGGVVVQGTTVYAGYMSAVVELDVSNPAIPRELAFVPLETGLPTAQLRISDGLLYAGFKGGLVAVLSP